MGPIPAFGSIHMKIQIISIGKNHDESIRSAIEDFTSRISHSADIDWKLMPSGRDTKEESVSILKNVTEKDYVILLDERGKELSSIDFSKVIETCMNDGSKRLVFIIGGAYGVSEEIKERADFIWSLSKLVFPHQLVRLILVEQIYRAFTILKGEKYHHI